MLQMIHLDSLSENRVNEQRIRTAPFAEMQVIWSFLFIIASVLLLLSIQQQLPVQVRATCIAFILYAIWILLTYRSYFIIDPQIQEIIYHNDVFFFGKRETHITYFSQITDVIVCSENEGFRNYLVIVYNTKTNNKTAKRIHDHDNLEHVHKQGKILASMFHSRFHDFDPQKQLLHSQYELNSLERRRGCLSSIGLTFVFAVATYWYFRS